MSSHNRSTEDSARFESTFTQTTSSARFSNLTGNSAILAVIYSFVCLCLHTSQGTAKCGTSANLPLSLTSQTDWLAVYSPLQVFAYWICTTTWCSPSIDRVEFSTTKDTAQTVVQFLSRRQPSSPNTKTRSHYGEISQTSKINKSKHSLNVLSIFSSVYLPSLCVWLLYDHMLESFFLYICRDKEIDIKIK